MATTKKRINISIPKTVEQALSLVAARDQVPQATKAVHLLQLALELEEDMIWDQVANTRDTKKARFVSHKQAWVVGPEQSRRA
ncbi:MAG: hypothetical protein Q7S62_02975 [bacterium]|nr:hypothetical protein [bacterium]